VERKCVVRVGAGGNRQSVAEARKRLAAIEHELTKVTDRYHIAYHELMKRINAQTPAKTQTSGATVTDKTTAAQLKGTPYVYFDQSKGRYRFYRKTTGVNRLLIGRKCWTHDFAPATHLDNIIALARKLKAESDRKIASARDTARKIRRAVRKLDVANDAQWITLGDRAGRVRAGYLKHLAGTPGVPVAALDVIVPTRAQLEDK
jgi:hypothetical protein